MDGAGSWRLPSCLKRRERSTRLLECSSDIARWIPSNFEPSHRRGLVRSIVSQLFKSLILHSEDNDAEWETEEQASDWRLLTLWSRLSVCHRRRNPKLPVFLVDPPSPFKAQANHLESTIWFDLLPIYMRLAYSLTIGQSYKLNIITLSFFCLSYPFWYSILQL